MDEYTWIWLYQSWIQDQEEKHRMYKDYSLFLGSFFNYEMAKNISDKDNPDYSTTDEEFDKSTELMIRQREAEFEKIKHRRKRRLVRQHMFNED